MSTASEHAPLDAHAGPRPVTGWPRATLVRLRRQALLVPEAMLLAVLLSLYALGVRSPLLDFVGLGVTLYFGARMALLSLSRQALARADYLRAERLTRAAAALYPASADAQALSGVIQAARGQPTTGVDALTHAVQLFPQSAELHATLSGALLDAGRPQEARASAQTALALDPHSPVAHLHLADADDQLGAAPDQVEALLRAGLSRPLQPAVEASLRCALAALLIRQGRAPEAQLALARSPQLLTACPVAQQAGLHFYLGELLQLQGDKEAAREHYRASEALDPGGPYAAAAWHAAHT